METAVLERPAGARIRPAGSSESAFRLGVSGRAAFRSCESVTQPSGSVLPPAAGSMASRARRVAVASFRKAGCTAGAPAAARPGRHGLHAPGSRASRSPLTRVAPRARRRRIQPLHGVMPCTNLCDLPRFAGGDLALCFEALYRASARFRVVQPFGRRIRQGQRPLWPRLRTAPGIQTASEEAARAREAVPVARTRLAAGCPGQRITLGSGS